MARILIVDDRPINRQFLAGLMEYAGHETLEAGDGVEALELLQAQRPDLTICDLMMPRMDGYEFVHQVRTSRSLAESKIILYTAAYRREEAVRLAEATGVGHVITKPCEPREILRIVEQVLQSEPTIAPRFSEDAFQATHVRLLTDSLVERANDLELVNAKLAALIELGIELAAQRDADLLLDAFVKTARSIVPAQWSVVAILDPSGECISWFEAAGAVGSAELAPLLQPRAGILGSILDGRRAARRSGPGASPAALGFANGHPPLESFLGVPLTWGSESVGWFYLANRLLYDAFTEEDERIACTLGTLLAVTFTNLRLSADVRAHAVCLEKEIAERRQAETALRASETTFSTAFPTSPASLSISRVADGTVIEVNDSLPEEEPSARPAPGQPHRRVRRGNALLGILLIPT